MNKEEAKKQIDEVINRLEWRHGGWTDSVKNDRTTAHAIIDKIESDHSKVKLPREVGEELEDWLKTDSVDTIIADLVCVSEGDPQDVRDWWNSILDATYFIADMARYGWEAEPEAKWYVQTPKEWWEDKNNPEYFDLDSMGISDGLKCKEYAAQFTRAELKKYHFDSDIFVLVPVEDEK